MAPIHAPGTAFDNALVTVKWTRCGLRAWPTTPIARTSTQATCPLCLAARSGVTKNPAVVKKKN